MQTLSVVCLLAVAACAPKESVPQGFAGTWVVKFDQRTFMVLTLKKTDDGFTGTLSRPEHFGTADGVRFSHLSASSVSEVIVSSSLKDDRLHLATENPKDKEDKTEYDVTLTGPDEASLKMADAPVEPWRLTRAPGASLPTVSTDWDPQLAYPQVDTAVSNPEMQRIYEEDQKPRQNFASLSNQELKALDQSDTERRTRTRKLIVDGQLHTGEDFGRAAFIFQHGSMPDDYLLAHTLAMIAVAKGDASALWISTATLDRYLQSIGKPQIYGTQFKKKADHTATQEPYNRDLILDSLRHQLGVPSLALQQDQLQSWTEQFKAAAEKSR